MAYEVKTTLDIHLAVARKLIGEIIDDFVNDGKKQFMRSEVLAELYRRNPDVGQFFINVFKDKPDKPFGEPLN